MKFVPKDCGCRFDGKAATKSLKPTETHEAFMNNLLHFVIPFENDERTFVVIINDTYAQKSLKKEQGMKGVFVIQGFTSNELSNENEEDLITLVANYLQS